MRFLLAAVLCLVLAGCASDVPEATPFPVLASVPGVQWGDVPVPPRVIPLELPTFTPVPTASPTLAPSTFVPTPTALSMVSDVSLLPSRLTRELRFSCRDDFRERLRAYSPGLPLGAEVAFSLSSDMVGDRPECGDLGWSPEFTLGISHCMGGRIGDVRFSLDLVELHGSLDVRRAGPTGRDAVGNILVHFERMPEASSSGCWYYSVERNSWSWMTPGDYGEDRYLFTECNEELRRGVLELDLVEARYVARLIDDIRRIFSNPCGLGQWDLFPRNEGYDFCGGHASGRQEDGLLVVNWHEDYPAMDGSLCWVWYSSDGVWADYQDPEGG